MTGFKNDKYFIRKTIVYCDDSPFADKGLLDTFEPITTQSKNYKNWRSILDLKTCMPNEFKDQLKAMHEMLNELVYERTEDSCFYDDIKPFSYRIDS